MRLRRVLMLALACIVAVLALAGCEEDPLGLGNPVAEAAPAPAPTIVVSGECGPSNDPIGFTVDATGFDANATRRTTVFKLEANGVKLVYAEPFISISTFNDAGKMPAFKWNCYNDGADPDPAGDYELLIEQFGPNGDIIKSARDGFTIAYPA